MFGPDQYARMKDGVILVNAARGGIFDEKSLADFLAAGKIGAVGIDVHESEPCTDSPLREFDNAILTPHEKEIVAYHEVGHALVAAKQSNSAPVTKITIVPRTSGALGYTMQTPETDQVLLSKEEALAKLPPSPAGAAPKSLFSAASPPARPTISSRPPSWRAAW